MRLLVQPAVVAVVPNLLCRELVDPNRFRRLPVREIDPMILQQVQVVPNQRQLPVLSADPTPHRLRSELQLH